MFYLTRSIGLALCALFVTTTSLFAQETYEVDLATITFVNQNLDENCQNEVIYLNLLSGDFDVDDDGNRPPESAFTINIDDADPSNGPILDGCGSFSFTIEPTPGGGVSGFTFGSGTINAFDVTPPAQFLTAEPNGPFFTTQLEDITINTLPSSVSRSFVVDGVTTFPKMGTIDALLMLRLLAGGEIPRFEDACSDIDVTVSDEITLNGNCEEIVITRTFAATDASATCIAGGTSSGVTLVSYDIILERPNGESVQAPAEVVGYECNDPDLVAGEFPEPDEEDYPFIEGPDGRVYLQDVFGNVGATYSDSEAIQVCTNTYKFVRTWTVIDWCDPENVRTFTQLVKVGDTSAPTIGLPTQDLDFDGEADSGPLVFSTNAPNCGAFISTNMGGLMTTDGCSSVAVFEAFVLFDGDAGNVSAPINVKAPNPIDRLTPFLPAGPHTLRYIATDDCGNETIAEVEILIEDRSGPVIIAEDALNVSLSNSGFAEVLASDVDNGSYDDCSEIIVEIAFANPNTLMSIGVFGPSITLTCIDVGAVPVILRATDASGNQNTRMSIINVVDNSAPLCIAPGPISLDCKEAEQMLPEDVNVFFTADPAGTINLFNQLFGEPTSLDNCGNELVTQVINSTINDCGTGVITRTFTVTDARGFVSAPGCHQFISVGGIRDYSLQFPADASATCSNSPVYGDVEYTALGCDMVVVSIDVDTFFASSDACFKLRRTIEIINWCEYDGIGAAYQIPRDADGDNNFGESTFLHVIPGGNTNALDDVAILDQDNNRNNSNSIGFLDPDDNNSGPIEVDGDNDGDTGYGNSVSRGAFRYVQFVKVYDNVAPTITNVSAEAGENTDCEGGDITIAYTVAEECTPKDVSTTAELDLDYVASAGFNASRTVSANEIINNGNGAFSVQLKEIPGGEHAIRVRGFDGCGNTNGRIIPFTITDNAPISPICVGTLTFVLMNDGDGGGIAVVEADDYVVDVMGNCGNSDILYSIYKEEEEAGSPTFMPQPGRASFTVDCDEVGDIMVRVYVFAPNGQNDYCSTTARITTFNEDICDEGDLRAGSMAGFITSPRNELLSGIEVHISDMAEMDDMMYTDENGSFLFTDLAVGGEYMIRPNMPDQVDLSRVKTSDIFKITNHILGVNDITDPYRLLAADVNADGVINVSDMVGIRRVILGLDDSFASGPTWRFIRRDFDLTGLEEGWDASIFPATFRVDELTGHNRDGDFVAIEVGDVFTEIIPRSARTLEAEDMLLAAGERVDLQVAASDLAGFQGTIQAAEGLVIEGWSSDLMGAGNVNDTQLSRGLLAFSYHENSSLEGVEIISLHLRADKELRISDYLSVTDRITYAEAVAPVGSTSALRLSFSQAPVGENLSLYQNFPNPVAAQTTIEFDLPTSSECLLQVHDLQGRLLTERLLQGVAGRNMLTLSTNHDLKNTTGILTYSLRVGQERLTKRMTVVAH